MDDVTGDVIDGVLDAETCGALDDDVIDGVTSPGRGGGVLVDCSASCCDTSQEVRRERLPDL